MLYQNVKGVGGEGIKDICRLQQELRTGGYLQQPRNTQLPVRWPQREGSTGERIVAHAQHGVDRVHRSAQQERLFGHGNSTEAAFLFLRTNCKKRSTVIGRVFFNNFALFPFFRTPIEPKRNDNWKLFAIVYVT